MDTKDKIITFIRSNGPSLPTKIAKQLTENSLFVSAHLSELKEQGKIKISNIKVGGGSPLYYISGQEAMLQNFVDNLGEKEKQVYDLLLQKKVLRDIALVPVFRAAIRTIKDFAFPFTVNFKGQQEIFWRWYLFSNEDTEKATKELLGIKEEKPELQTPTGNEMEKKKEEKKPIEKKVEQQKEKIQEKTIEKKKEEKSGLIEEKKEEQKKPQMAKEEKKSDFHNEVLSYFNKKNIRVLEENILRKSSEIEFIVELPSPVGSLKYFVRAKSKRKINDGDLSSVFIQAQTKRLPALFLAKGDLTKKAQNMLETEFRGMRYNKLE